MSTKDYITTPLDMKDVVLKNIEEDAQEITIEIELAQLRSRLSSSDDSGSGSAWQADDAPLPTQTLPLPRMREKFAEECSFAGRYQRFTHRVTAKTIDLLRRRSSLKVVAEDVGISRSGVNRVLNALAVPKPAALPEAISFDKFKGNLGGERFQCIATGHFT